MLINFSFSQQIILIDEETLEFIPDVYYYLYNKKMKVFSNICNNESVTFLNHKIEFDSIVFENINYLAKGIKKENIEEVVYLKKKTHSLEEVVITNKLNKNDTIIGEKNKFLNRQNRALTNQKSFGLRIENNFKNPIIIKSFKFFVEKVKYKTC